jgi:purine-nucleoside phosphorylase
LNLKKNFKTDTDLARHIIEFDPEVPATHAKWTLPQAAVMARATMRPIRWPSGLAPKPQPISSAPKPADVLPACDYLVVTWTVAEALALADVLTPGYGSKSDWYNYAKDYASTYSPLIRMGAPASQSKRLGSYFVTKIGGKKVLCFKSELHMSQDGPKLPIKLLWKQLIAETGAKLIITTGTAGGIGSAIELGDVVIAKSVRFDCTKTFKNSAFHNGAYVCSTVNNKYMKTAVNQLMPANTNHLPNLPTAKRTPNVFTKATGSIKPLDVVTTDFFAFDDTNDNYGLRGLGSAVEMGDAVLGLAVQEIGATAPRWTAIRNASDPQIDGSQTLAEQKTNAAQIYEKYGYWTTVCSAIATWAVIAGD